MNALDLLITSKLPLQWMISLIPNSSFRYYITVSCLENLRYTWHPDLACLEIGIIYKVHRHVQRGCTNDYTLYIAFSLTIFTSLSKRGITTLELEIEKSQLKYIQDNQFQISNHVFALTRLTPSYHSHDFCCLLCISLEIKSICSTRACHQNVRNPNISPNFWAKFPDLAPRFE